MVSVMWLTITFDSCLFSKKAFTSAAKSAFPSSFSKVGNNYGCCWRHIIIGNFDCMFNTCIIINFIWCCIKYKRMKKNKGILISIIIYIYIYLDNVTGSNAHRSRAFISSCFHWKDMLIQWRCQSVMHHWESSHVSAHHHYCCIWQKLKEENSCCLIQRVPKRQSWDEQIMSWALWQPLKEESRFGQSGVLQKYNFT